MNLKKKYKLHKDVNESLLKDNGFRRYVFKCYVYKDIIQLIIHIDLEEKHWDYQVYDDDNNIIYIPYYNRDFGTNKVVKSIDKKMNKIFKELEKVKIFVPVKENNNEKNC